MKFRPLAIAGAYAVEPEPCADERGFFARTWCASEFEARGLAGKIVQSSVSFNHCRGTLRGMHLQARPFAEAKLIRCTRGSLFDVIVDLRPESPTYRTWNSLRLTAADGVMLYVPEGLAHGFQTLEDCTEVTYQMSAPYHPESARGFRWDDPAFGIAWPIAKPIISRRDASYCDFKEPFAR